MSTKSTPNDKGSSKATPHDKGSSKSNRSTLRLRTSGLLPRAGSASKIKSGTCLDLTSRNLSIHPSVRTNLLNVHVDKEVECAVAYSGYLQSLIKKLVISEAIKKHEDSISDQLVLQKDNLYKNKLMLQKIQEQNNQQKQMEEVQHLLNVVEKNFVQLQKLQEDCNLNENLKELIDCLRKLCNLLYLENVKKLEKGDINKLETSVQQSLQSLQEICSMEKNMEEIYQLAAAIKKYRENLQSIGETQTNICTLQKSELHKFLKSVSDFYASKE